MEFEKTYNKPYVNLSLDDRIFEIKGPSFSKSVTERYVEILNWIDQEIPKLDGELNCTFYFDVLNSISYKSILEIFTKFSHYQKEGKRFNITWFCDPDDEDNQENAEQIQEIFDVPLIIKEAKRK